MPQHTSIQPPITKSIFIIQTENVRALDKAWVQGNRLLNESLRNQDSNITSLQTKLMALLFSAYTEAIFSKLIHTPHALKISEITKLKDKFRDNSYEGWVACLKLVVSKITSKDNAYKNKIISDITVLLQNYIKDPSEIRNRIAHGQWIHALNRKHTQQNIPLTIKITDLNIVTLTKFKKSFSLMSLMIEELIESPNKAHVNFYQKNIKKFNDEQQRMASWTMVDRITKLKPKPKLRNYVHSDA